MNTMHRAMALTGAAIERLERDRPDLTIRPDVTAAGIRAHLKEAYGAFATPMELEELIPAAADVLRHWNVHVTHRRYFGLFNPSVHPAGVAADALVAAFNPQLAAWSHAPGACEIEQYTLGFFASQLGLSPDECGMSFTSGGAEANQSALITALTERIKGFAEQGLAGTDARPTLYASHESHHSLGKAARAAGLGSHAVRHIPVGRDLKLDVHALARQVEEDRQSGMRPFMVVATAGTTGGGIIDPLAAIAAHCEEQDLWLHVDAAWGGAACLSPRLKPALEGIERAQSITWDAHKWLCNPMGAGMFFCARPDAVQAAFAIDTPYMPAQVDGTADPYRHSMQWSRRHIGLKVFMTLASLGFEGYRTIIEHQASMAELLRERLLAGGFQIVNLTPLPTVCFTHSLIESGKRDIKEVVEAICKRNCWVSVVRLGEELTAIRACITSHETDEEDIAALVAAACEAIGAQAPSS